MSEDGDGVTRLLSTVAHQIQKWTPFDDEKVDGIVALLKLVGADDQLIRDIFRSARLLSEASTDSATDPSRAWVSQVSRLWTALSAEGLWDDLLRDLTIELLTESSVEDWSLVCAELVECDDLDLSSEAGRAFTERIRPDLTVAEIEEWLAVGLTSKSWGIHQDACIRVSSICYGRTEWPGLTEAAKAGIIAEDTSYTEALNLLAACESISSHETFSDLLVELCNTCHIGQFFTQANAANDANSAAVLFIYGLAGPTSATGRTPEATQALEVQNRILTGAQVPNELLEMVHAKVADSGLSWVIFDHFDRNPDSKPFILEYLERTLTSDRPWETLSPEELIDHASLVIEACKRDRRVLQGLMAKMCSGSAMLSAMKELKGSFNQFLYDAAASTTGVGDEEFSEMIAAGLESASTEAWISELDGTTFPAYKSLLLRLLDAGRKMTLTDSFVSAYVAYLQKAAQGTSAATKPPDWEVFKTCLTSSQLETVQRGLLDALTANGSDTSPDFLKLVEQEIVRLELLRSKPELLPKFFTPLVLARKDPRGLRWLHALVESEPAQFKRAHTKGVSKIFKQQDLRDFADAVKRVSEYRVSSPFVRTVRAIATLTSIKFKLPNG